MDDADDAARDPEIDERRRLDAELVERVRAGDESAFGEIYDTWFDRVHDLALRIVRNPETASEVAQDTFLAAWQKLDTLEQPASFGGWLLRIARNRALNRSEREKRSTAVGDDTMAVIEAGGELVSAPAGFRVEERVARADDPAIATEDNEVADLLWSAAAALGERDQTVLTLQLRFGMTPAEIGETLGVNRNAANQMVHRVKGRLDSAVQARVLWDGDRPRCERLEAALVAAGIHEFGAEAVKIAEKHADECDECGDRRRLRLQPAALFGALPVLVAPQFLKQKVAAALAADGVPVDPARYWPSPEGPAQEPSIDGRDPVEPTSSPGSDGEPPAGSNVESHLVVVGDEAPPPPPWSSRRIAAVAAAAALVVVVGIALFLASRDGDGDESLAADDTAEVEQERARRGAEGERDEVEAPEGPASTDTAPTTVPTDGPADSTATTQGSLEVGPTLDGADDLPGQDTPPFVDPGPSPVPPGPGPTPPPPPVNRIVTFSVSPSTAPLTYAFDLDGITPKLEWAVQPGYEAEVTLDGTPAFVRRTSSGGEVVCPTIAAADWFHCSAPPGAYTYRLRVKFAGQVVQEATVTLRLS